MLRKSAKIKFVSTFTAVSVIIILILTGPAHAFTLSVSPSQSSVNIGEQISFIASLDIDSGERLPIEYLELEISGKILCKFNPNGNAISGCSDLTISKISDANYTSGNRTGNFSGTEYSFGYGYGYGYGTQESLSYNITLNSAVLGAGTFSTKLKAKMLENANVFESAESSLIVRTNQTAGFNLTVNEPSKEVYNTRRVPFNLTTTKKVEKISYINYNDNHPREKVLCTDCNEYGKTRKKSETVNEGQNNLKFSALDEFGNIKNKNVSFFVDSKKPYIEKTEPIRGFTFGNFSIKFEENNPKILLLNYGNSIKGYKNHELNITEDCSLDKRYFCNVLVNLSDYDGQEIEYFFNLTDIAGSSDESRKRKLSVDMTSPKVNSINYRIKGRRVDFVFNVTEINLDRITYLDKSAAHPKEKTLCRKLNKNICENTEFLNDGLHEIEFKIIDQARNSVTRNASFFIDSIKPNIKKTEPVRGFASGKFSIEFREDNPASLVLNYGNLQTGMKEKNLNISADCIFYNGDYECETNTDLAEYDGQNIKYWFKLTDISGQSATSRLREVKVKVTP